MTLALLLLAGSWSHYGGDLGGERFVRGGPFTRANVARLRPRWTFRTGETPENGPGLRFECTPVYADGLLYVVTGLDQVIALDPDSGRERWRHDPKIPRRRPLASEPYACRGVSLWRDPATRRLTVFLASYDARLIALDGATGRPRATFGKEGTVDLWEGMGRKFRWNYSQSSPPCVAGDRVIVGSCIGDNGGVDMPSGVVRAFDARSGKLLWAWEPLGPRPDGTPEDRYSRGAANAWTPISADPARDLLVLSTGSPSPDFCGIERPGDNRDANSVVALRLSTGRKLWSFQAVRHDLWDYDVPAQPILTDVGDKPAVVVLTKMGYVYVLDRLTGKPLLPVRDVPVPASDVPGEKAASTQPQPVLPKPLVSDRFKPWGVTSEGKAFVERVVAGARNEGIFTPPSVRGTVLYPGNVGGSNWSGGSVDAKGDTLFVNTNSLATLVKLVPRADYAQVARETRDEANGMNGTPYGMVRHWIFAPGGVPGNPPPWGQLHAVDLKTGALRWSRPLGVLPALADHPQAAEWGCPNLGGSLATDTGLVFLGATQDKRLRAFDARNGRTLWEGELPHSANAAPMAFRSSMTGRWYVVVCAGGVMNEARGDAVVAFGL